MASSIPGIIISLGSPNSKDGELYSVARQRCELGLKEYLSRSYWKIVLTGGFGEHFNVSDKPHAHYLKKYLIELGVEAESIDDYALSTNTLEDASLSKPIVLKYDIDEILVITSDFHYDRARYIFEREYADTNIRIHFKLCDTNDRTCGFDLQRQIRHEKESLKKLKNQNK